MGHFKKMGFFRCCVFECGSTSNTIPKLKFHAIPAKAVKRKRWIEQICKHSGFRNAFLGDYSVICSLHFSKDCYEAGRLSVTADPTIFFKPQRRIKDAPARTSAAPEASADPSASFLRPVPLTDSLLSAIQLADSEEDEPRPDVPADPSVLDHSGWARFVEAPPTDSPSHPAQFVVTETETLEPNVLCDSSSGNESEDSDSTDSTDSSDSETEPINAASTKRPQDAEDSEVNSSDSETDPINAASTKRQQDAEDSEVSSSDSETEPINAASTKRQQDADATIRKQKLLINRLSVRSSRQKKKTST